MNPVISAQATEILRLIKTKDAMQAHMFLEQSHLPFDVQDLIFAALNSLPKLDNEIAEEVIEFYTSQNSFNERLLH